jgi:hypothetical protein
MNRETYNYALEFITKTLNTAQPFIDVESFDSVNHYIKHAEIEMAFEMLFLEIINQNLSIEVDSKTTMRVATDLNLDKETVFDVDFWNKLQNFISNNNV